MANPIPNPSNIRPTISIQTFFARPLNKAPRQKSKPPKSIDNLRPNILVTVDATIEDKRAAKYKDDVNIVSV